MYLKDENGFKVDVSQVDTLPHDNHDLTTIRINVDNSPSGFLINLVQHIKKEVK